MPRAPIRIIAALVLSLGPVSGPPALAQEAERTPRDRAAVAALAGLLALGVIGAIVSDDDDDDRDEVARRGRDEDDRWGRDDWGRDGHDRSGGDRALSADCVRRVPDGRRVVAGECLERRAHRARLPDRCLSWVRADGRDRPVYDLRCLRGAGHDVR